MPCAWRQPKGKLMVSLVKSHTNATRIGWHLWEIDLRFAPWLPPGWICVLNVPDPPQARVRTFPRTLSCEYGTYNLVKARFRPGLEGKGP